jgi:hypothetical protein
VRRGHTPVIARVLVRGRGGRVSGGALVRPVAAGGAEEAADRLVALGRKSLEERVEDLVPLVVCVG